ncbi:hypothetical protein ASPSYDRAFT_93472 [Aspergillus sydowii CBS 593.65]|uniref:Acyl-CoA thioesterase II n=1 Tax=Aspergillus sydowii CBS 593.65 TaxID=1036612 RepID=A0A1L9T5I9_9EURO|nr:uncharacterized protein ASPSYDRAFT_93472 [Aspergillus sydowii CBS 593.65]OJJ54553.1 hypothetical protein ASPSYDRAFT_93472 [Aspergillus sydowii CBS 593.65]
MPDPKAITLSQQIAVRSLSSGRFTSVRPPTRLGSLTATGFGGSCLAVAVNAAYQDVGENFHLYSISGHFIRPTRTDRKLFCDVENVRKSRSFHTSEVRVTQEADDGVSRLCLIALADFHVEKPRSMVVYSYKTSLSGNREICGNGDSYPSAGDTTAPGVKRSESETALPLAIHAERFRSRTPLGNEAEQVSSLAFYMDKGLGYIPALHCGYRPSDARACASLDFSLRLFDHELDIQKWHVTEQKSVVANNARAYSEGRVWDSNGRLLACMTQQTILRPNSATTSHI